MIISNVFHGFWHYDSNAIFNKAEKLLEGLNDCLADRVYTTDLQLDEIHLSFQNPEAIKSRVRPYYMAARDMEKDDPWGPYSLMALIYEIPLPERDFIKVSEEELPTFIGKILLEHLETHDVPTKIRKQFDRERFIADVRDFFVNVKGCKL
ncbi:MAG: hypothetical protein K6E73_00610 [Bacteroidales bacterium]|nr:hypothetical protein [Bacteroidales bacterium]